MLEEDKNTKYANLIQKIYASQGILSNQKCCFISRDESEEEIRNSLPADDSKVDSEDDSVSQEKLSIAWRYENKAAFSESKSVDQSFCKVFDISKRLSVPSDSFDYLKFNNFQELQDSLFSLIDTNYKYLLILIQKFFNSLIKAKHFKNLSLFVHVSFLESERKDRSD